MASPLDLTTLAAVKAWMPEAASGNSDTILVPLITAASRVIYAYLSRPSLLPRAFSERYDGQGNRRLFLRNWPVLSLTSVTAWGTSIPVVGPPSAAQPIPNGALLSPWDGTPPGAPQDVDVYGNWPWLGCDFGRGRQNISISYQAGYAVQSEAQAVPAAPGPYTTAVDAPYGAWASDLGVSYAAGRALTPVTGTPAEGQYSVAAGFYTFAAADTGAAVLVSYGFVPADIAQVCAELVGERFSYRQRIGNVSKSVGGQETVSFSQKDMPDALKLILQPYRSVYPL